MAAYGNEPAPDRINSRNRRLSLKQTAVCSGLRNAVCGLAYKPEREKLIGYPELAMGSESYSIVKHDSDSSINADPKSFAGKLDLLTAEGNGAYGRAHTEVPFSFGGAEYYLCVSKKRSDLLDELNTAQNMLAAKEPNYLNSLNLKYYPVRVFTSAIWKTICRTAIRLRTAGRTGTESA